MRQVARSPRALESREDVYDMLLNDTVIVRIPVSRERGQSFAFHPRGAVVRPVIDDQRIALEASRYGVAMADFFGVPSAQRSMMPVRPEPAIYEALVQRLHETTGARHLLFEGYAVDPAEEGSALMAHLAQVFNGTLHVFNPPPMVVSTWNHKPTFTRRVAERLGDNAVAPGVTTSDLSDIRLVTLIEAFREQSPVGKVILKIVGAGGLGNMVFNSRESWEDIVAKLAALRESPVWRFAKDALIEAWIPWKETFCCSFFITNEGVAFPMEICSQVISEKTAGFMGGTSVVNLAQGEVVSITKTLMAVVEQMAEEGMRGFLAIDVIVSEGGGGLMLPSGRDFRLIEANMRINGHNQERIFVRTVAQRDHLHGDEIDHLRLGAHARASDMEATHALFHEALRGVAVPFSEKPIVPGVLNYLVLDNHGTAPSLYDAVLFFGAHIDARVAFNTAKRALEAKGLLKV